MKVPYRKIFRITLAVFLFIPGIIGLFLPILNGTLFIVAGLLILSLEIPALEVWLDKMGSKNSKVNRFYVKIKHFTRKHL